MCTFARRKAQMAESVDALVSNTSGAIRAGSTPALGTCKFSNALQASTCRVFFWEYPLPSTLYPLPSTLYPLPFTLYLLPSQTKGKYEQFVPFYEYVYLKRNEYLCTRFI